VNLSLWMATVLIALGPEGTRWLVQMLQLGWRAATGALPLLTQLVALAAALRTWRAGRAAALPRAACSAGTTGPAGALVALPVAEHRVVIRLDSHPGRIEVHTNRPDTHLTIEFDPTAPRADEKKRPARRSNKRRPSQ
jgi:hypothetical protein